MSNLQLVALLPCPDRTLLLRLSVPLGRPFSFQLNKCPLVLLQQCIDPAHAPPPSPYALGPNTSDTATVALLALPADPTPAGPSAMASAVPTTGSAPPHLCMSTPGGLTSLASVLAFTTVPGSWSHVPYSAAHVRACSASALVPALSAAYTLALSITHHHHIAPPWQCNFLHHCCHS